MSLVRLPKFEFCILRFGTAPTWDGFGTKSGTNVGPIWDWSGTDLGSVWDRFGIDLESVWDRFGIDLPAPVFPSQRNYDFAFLYLAGAPFETACET